MTRAPRLLLAVLWGAAASAGAPAASLEEALVLAYRTNPSLEAARAQFAAAEEDVEQALASVLPQVSLSVDAYDWEDAERGGKTPSIHRAAALGSVAVRQSLRLGFGSLAAIDIARSAIRAEEAGLLSAEQNTLFAAANAYANVIREQAVLDLNVGNERVIERQLEAARDRFDVGEITRTDVSQAESRLARARAQRISAEGRLAVARAAYVNAVGQPAGALAQPTPLAAIPATLAAALERAREGNLAVARNRALAEAARQRTEQLRRERWPTLTLNGEYGYDDEFQGGGHRERLAVTLGLTMPLYTSGSISSRLRQAGHLHARARENSRQSLQTALETTTSAWQRLLAARAQISAFAAAVTAGEIALAGVTEEAAAGTRTVLDVLDAEQELLDANVGLLGARRDEIVGTYQLRRSIGALTARDLNLPVE